MNGLNNKELTTLLEKHYDAVIGNLKELMHSKFEGIREAILKSDAYATYRDSKQNEFQGALNDAGKRAAEQEKTFASKTDVANLNKQFEIWMSGIKQLQEANFNVLSDSLRDIKIDMEKVKNIKQGGNQAWLILIAGGSILIAFITLVTNIFIK
jgi:hypothetical protein